MFEENSIYSYQVRTLDQREQTLESYRGKVLLVVNTASGCGFTPQYKGLEELYQKYRDRGFCVLGFPCNQFGAQEPGSAEEIRSFCELNYSVTFPLFEKIEVNGERAHPLFTFLKREGKGLLGTEAIKWNFTKFLINKKGEVFKRYAPTTSPLDIASDIEALLEKS